MSKSRYRGLRLSAVLHLLSAVYVAIMSIDVKYAGLPAVPDEKAIPGSEVDVGKEAGKAGMAEGLG